MAEGIFTKIRDVLAAPRSCKSITVADGTDYDLPQNTTRLHFNSAGVYVLEYADGTKAGFSVYDRSEKSGRFTKIVGSDSSHTGAGVVIAEIG